MDLDLGIVFVAPGSVTIESLLNIPSWFPVGNMIHTSAKPVSNLMWLVAFANLPELGMKCSQTCLPSSQPSLMTCTGGAANPYVG